MTPLRFIQNGKCGADFVYLTEGCGMTLTEINEYPTLE